MCCSSEGWLPPSYPPSLPPSLPSFLSLFLRFYLFIFREREREGDREGEKHPCARETSINYLSHIPNWVAGPQSRHVP